MSTPVPPRISLPQPQGYLLNRTGALFLINNALPTQPPKLWLQMASAPKDSQRDKKMASI